MKLKMLSVIVALGLLTGFAQASVVSVSSTTVTTIVASNSGRAMLVLYNNSTNPVYYASSTSSATVAAGMILPSSSTITLEGFKGTVYGLAGTAAATSDVRYFTISR